MKKIKATKATVSDALENSIASKKSGHYILTLLALIVLGSNLVMAETVMHPSIPILDEQGRHVLDSGKPYSSRMTCGTGGCHDYEAITSAYHFQMGRDEASDDFGKRHGLPQLVSPGYYGGYACMGGSNPDVLAKKTNASTSDFADRGSAGWVQRCISCHTGGGWMEKDRNGNRYDETDPKSVVRLDGDYFNRGTDENNQSASADIVKQWDWKKSGVVEADCFICHADLGAMIKTDPQMAVPGSSDADRQFRDLRRYVLAGYGYFRYAGTAILEFINLNDPADPNETDRSLLNFSRDTGAENKVHMRSTPNYSLNLNLSGEPILNWNADAFVNGKVKIPMLRYPENNNCMICHRTSNSRRGFYGFGEGASATYTEDGVLEEDYHDDVHKGASWTENGQTRNIENCNACHSRNYYKSLASTSNVDLDADHNFMKGNSDMDLRNDLDYSPNARSCVYCHDTAETPAIPSGQDTILNAHLEKWKANGDMFGYSQNSLVRITQTHLDVVSCQACHITNKKSRGKPLQIMYRYRQEEDGKLRMIPYNPRIRYYWKDRNSGRVLNKTERNSVFKAKTASDGSLYGVIIDPETGQELSQVSARMSHGSMRFGDPEDYQGFTALKKAYDKVLTSKGVAAADAVMVWTESNQYVMNHNTRPAVDSLQCAQCHSKTSRGAFSALLSADGILGENTVKKVATLADRRIYDEGMVVLDLPYMKIDGNGVITENVSDILYETRINPSLTVLDAARAREVSGRLQKSSINKVADKAGLHRAEDRAKLVELMGSNAYIFSPVYGDPVIRSVALIPPANSVTERTFPDYRMHIAIASDDVISKAGSAGLGALFSSVISLEAIDINGSKLSSFAGTRLLVKIPYTGSNTNLDEVKVITSGDGENWAEIDASDISILRPQTKDEDGFVMFWTGHFSYYAVANSTVAAVNTDASAGDVVASGGGGSVSWLALIMAFFVFSIRVVRAKQRKQVI
ncbi:MAG TPA: cytochrome C [Gammaproteobacteria bacterium]|nr:cytochrome C [Gammaproteobacteria bacterium]